MDNSNNINDILKAMDIINTCFVFDVFIPSLQKTVSFKQLTTGQEKFLLKEVMAGRKFNIYKTVKTILTQCCTDPSVNIGDFTMVDLYLTLIKLRINSIGDIMKLVITTRRKIDVSKYMSKESIEGLPKGKVEDETIIPDRFNISVDLNDICNRIEKLYKNSYKTIVSDENSPYIITCDMPTVDTMVNLIDYIISVTETEENSIESGEETILEAMKFFTGISIKNNENGKTMDVDLSNMTYRDKSKIFDSIPTNISSKAIETIMDMVHHIESLTLYNITHDGQTFTQSIDIMSVDFFIVF